ncbi:MAG: DsrE family protein [candidate division KSB1 bacterium]|nr:DsrE family protein [candidate division KSB1 bacterium]
MKQFFYGLILLAVAVSAFAQKPDTSSAEKTTCTETHQWEPLSDHEQAPCCEKAADSAHCSKQHPCHKNTKNTGCKGNTALKGCGHDKGTHECQQNCKSNCAHDSHSGCKTCQCQTDSLVILWSTGDADVFSKVIFPYSINAAKQGWWQSVEVLIWGPSANRVKEDKDLHEKLKQAKTSGVTLTACQWCAEQYKAVDVLENLGVDVKYMGKPLTRYLKSGHKVLVF